MVEKEDKTMIEDETRPLGKRNLLLIAVSVVLIIVGFVITGSGEPSTEEAFNPDIFSTMRIVVGPAISFIGFVFTFFAILYKKRK